jgi:hypothetical protein
LADRAAEAETTAMAIGINGMAHVVLTVSRFELAREFYRRLLPEFGMKPVYDGDKLIIASAGAPRSASSRAIRHSRPNASGNSASGCTICVCARARGRTSIAARRCSRR